MLEHTLFWFISLLSWAAFTRLKDVHLPTLPKRKPIGVLVISSLLVLATSTSIFSHNQRFFHRRTSAIEAVQVGDHLYKVSFPFLGGSTVFEESIRLFKATHPGERIDHIYTVPNPLRLKKADALIFLHLDKRQPMKEHAWLRGAILVFWTLFWGLSVVDKIIPDVNHFWVGKDFFALFVKFFASLGLKDPMFATVALAGVSGLEAVNFTLYATAFWALVRGDAGRSETWFYRGIVTSLGLFVLFSMADQVFGDRFQLLEHGLFWMVLLASWIAFKFFAIDEAHSRVMGSVRPVLLVGAP